MFYFCFAAQLQCTLHPDWCSAAPLVSFLVDDAPAVFFGLSLPACVGRRRTCELILFSVIQRLSDLDSGLSPFLLKHTFNCLVIPVSVIQSSNNYRHSEPARCFPAHDPLFLQHRRRLVPQIPLYAVPLEAHYVEVPWILIVWKQSSPLQTSSWLSNSTTWGSRTPARAPSFDQQIQKIVDSYDDYTASWTSWELLDVWLCDKFYSMKLYVPTDWVLLTILFKYVCLKFVFKFKQKLSK